MQETGISTKLPFSFAKRHNVLINGTGATIVYTSQSSPEVLLELQRFLSPPVDFKEVPEEDFDNLLMQAYETRAGAAMQVIEDIQGNSNLEDLVQSLPKTEELLESENDAPIIRLLNALLSEAVKQNASDIHIEPFEEKLIVRFRIDGVLREILQPQRHLAPLIISRIKVMARLDIAEKRLPQDGRIGVRIAGRNIDLRVSTLPSGHGERVVLRILDKKNAYLGLNHLGMSNEILERLIKVISRPHGIILVTGPTGSGKSTTLYATLTELNTGKRNILTVEDPIEYYLPGIGQTQVNYKVDMTFARGLRAILRQDPDIVMVGEVRDLDTAKIAVQASLTGHLVLSTLHTNTAIGSISRLEDMGVESFLLASSLNGLIAQRLVRLLCPDCKKPITADSEMCRILGVKNGASSPTIYEPVGCEKCYQQGYLGRTGIYELIEVDDQIRKMIHQHAPQNEMEEYAHQNFSSLRQDGVRLILSGLTSLEEVLRVTIED
jgi:general secretion pathway protein E